MLGGTRLFVASLTLVLLGLTARSGEAETPDDPRMIADFENRVRPILAVRCVKCHGPQKQESNLRLDSRAAMMQGGASGPAIVPGRPEESLLVKAVRHKGDLQMPPDTPLKDEQIAMLTQWVADGAPWPDNAGAAAVRRG